MLRMNSELIIIIIKRLFGSNDNRNSAGNNISKTNMCKSNKVGQTIDHIRLELYIFVQSGKKDLERRCVLHKGTDSE